MPVWVVGPATSLKVDIAHGPVQKTRGGAGVEPGPALFLR
jgi:hypothetical protein